MARAGRINFRVKTTDLEKAVTRFTKAKAAEGRLVVRRVATGIASDLQKNTPVLTGRARAGWSPILIREGGAQLVEGPDANAVQEGRSRGEVIVRTSDPIRPRITVANGVVYIHDLNAGRSPQAEAGWFQRTLERWTQHLNREANGR